MATHKQTKANRANAMLSIGPRTKKEKQRSAKNAVGHGLNIPIDLLTKFNSQEMDPEDRGKMHHLSEEYLEDIDLDMGGKFWRKLLKNELERPYEDQRDQLEQVTIEFLDKQRRLNRYELKAVSTLSKLYRKAYKR